MDLNKGKINVIFLKEKPLAWLRPSLGIWADCTAPVYRDLPFFLGYTMPTHIAMVKNSSQRSAKLYLLIQADSGI